MTTTDTTHRTTADPTATAAAAAAARCPSFVASADGYDRLMGRYLPSLAPAFADAAGVVAGLTALDVGCGPGGFTRELVARLGVANVAAADPSPPFVAACRDRLPGIDVREAAAERLPFDDGAFDLTLSSLVVGFLADREAGAREMLRVTRPGGTVAACFWSSDGMPALRTFWAAAASLDPSVQGDGIRFGTEEGDLTGWLAAAGATDVTGGRLTATSTYDGADDWWSGFTQGVGPVGAYLASLDAGHAAALRDAAWRSLGAPEGAFTLTNVAWWAKGVVA
ncbi:MAG TPA: class I SAM-dependent methyltransferase [Frankiaceae bacterium]|nr:class I SAM-dependent methyltransferase [Frankiaceae bacterium]